MDSKKVLVCVWLPCSGKGTQSRILAEKINAHRIESWARLDMIIRWEISPELSEIASKVRRNPRALSESQSSQIEYAKLGDDYWKPQQELVLDGFWRRLDSYNMLCEIFWRDNLAFLWFHISKKTMKARASQRWIDPETRRSYHLPEGQAKQIGLVRREADSPAILWRRYSSFTRRVLPILNDHKDAWWNVIQINAGHSSIQGVTKDMMTKIEKTLEFSTS